MARLTEKEIQLAEKYSLLALPQIFSWLADILAPTPSAAILLHSTANQTHHGGMGSFPEKSHKLLLRMWKRWRNFPAFYVCYVLDGAVFTMHNPELDMQCSSTTQATMPATHAHDFNQYKSY